MGVQVVAMTLQFDPSIEAVRRDPFPIFRQLQDEEPVHWSEPLKSWVVTRYADVRRVAFAPEHSADRVRPFLLALPDASRRRLADIERYLVLWAVFRDPPEHTRVRALMNAAFTPRVVEGLRPGILRTVSELLDAVAETGRMDVIRDLAYPLPATVVMDMLGVPRSELELVKRWSDDIALFVGGARATPAKYERAQAGTRAMADYFRDLVEDRRRRPRDDVTTALVRAEQSAQRLSSDEVIATCILLLFAGHETTANLIGNGTLCLATHPDQQRRLRADPRLIDRCVEECLRYDGPTGALARVVAVEHELGGRTLREGDRVYAMVNAANRDPRQFEDPDVFDIGRRDNRHLTFGHGIHHCLGAPLARLEGQLAIGELVRRFDDLTVTEEPLEWIDSLALRGVASLPVAFRATGRSPKT